MRPILTNLALALLLTGGACRSAERRAPRLQVEAGPRVVGRPPADASVGLIRVNEREIRHYTLEGVFWLTPKGLAMKSLGGFDPSRLQGPFRTVGAPVLSYTRSRDNGRTWEEEARAGPQELLGARTIRRNPSTGEFFAIAGGLQWIARARDIDGPWEKRDTGLPQEVRGGVRDLYFARGGTRLLVPVQGRGECWVVYSDDQGITWKPSNRLTTPPHEAGGRDLAERWNHGAVEPCVVELRDGRLWMLIRCAQDEHYESFSSDGGATWSPARPSRFHGTCTMSVVGRLTDGRLLILWNNTLPMSELPGERRPGWEDVFTNRNAIHAAISDDDGRTWRGFRELHLDERRNESDYAETGGTDRGTQQGEFVDLGDGWVLVSLGQHPLHRRLVIFHTDWLYGRSRADDFSRGLIDWCTFKYVADIRGHCAYNRREGAMLVPHPDDSGRQALHLRRPRDPALACENDGAVWNFPAGESGSLRVRILLQPGGQGGRISLLDRWVNPTDLTAHLFASFNLDFTGGGRIGGETRLSAGRWHELQFAWRVLKDVERDECLVHIDGREILRIPLNRPAETGLSYLHLISTAAREDTAGFLIDRVRADAD